MVMNRVPGVTGTKNPCGTMRRSSSSKLTPASTVAVPPTVSIHTGLADGLRRMTVPPPFCAGSPYARPRPRVMAPRLPNSMVARPSAPTDSTLAEVADVLPQPVSNCRSPISGSVRPFGRGTAEFGHDLAQACRQEHLEGDVFHEPRQLCKLPRCVLDSVERSAREVSPVDRHRS